jgi:hypothetical protein
LKIAFSILSAIAIAVCISLAGAKAESAYDPGGGGPGNKVILEPEYTTAYDPGGGGPGN